jgi:hypothetical protein
MHKTSLILIKNGNKAHVDTGIVRAVNHINGYAGAETIYSCEGEPNGEPYDENAPYILFKTNQATLLNLMRDFDSYEVLVNVLYADEYGLRYNVRFCDKYELDKFQSHL